MELLRFTLQTSTAWVWINEFVFSYPPPSELPNNFDGEVSNCRVSANGELLDTFSYNCDYYWPEGGIYICIDPEAYVWPMVTITTQPTTFSLICAVKTNSPNQALKMRLAGVWTPNWPEEYQLMFGELPVGNELIFP